VSNKEATARIKINKLLEAAGWRFFAESAVPANIRLEPSVTLKSSDLDALSENFEQTSKGFIDFLLLDAKGFPLIVLEAKSEDKNPLVGNLLWIRSLSKLDPYFLKHCLDSIFADGIDHIVFGAAYKALTIEKLKEFKIPLPPLATQQAIVAEIEAEQALVAANRELIARFEEKIQTTLARVWGENDAATAKE
jgi:hypothetical protein